jgi:hypothetical protein
LLGTAQILPDGEVVPVPEPATWICVALGLGLIFLVRRRWQRTIAS